MLKELTVREYWEQRAKAARSPRATTDDVWLRELEFQALAEALRGEVRRGAAHVLDAGCGDGYTTLRLAERFPLWKFTGVDFAESMLRNAEAALGERPELSSRVCFRRGDVTRLGEAVGDQECDIALTVRCLINLESEQRQKKAMEAIARCLRPGGSYLAVENFLEGHEAMNAARERFGLHAIAVRWHNRYFTEASFREAAEPWFELVQFQHFSSSYYLATRVLYTAWCRETGQEIDYNHPLHQLAARLPWCGQYSPVRLALLRRSHSAGRS